MRIKIKTDKIGRFFKKLPWILGKRAFLTFLTLLMFELILGVFLFYQYIILIERAEPQIVEESLRFDEKTHQEVLKVWQEKKKRFKEANFKQHPDLFHPILSEEFLEETELTE